MANTGSDRVSDIADSTNSVVVTDPVGTSPHGVAYDSGKAEVFVTNYGAATVSVLSNAV